MSRSEFTQQSHNAEDRTAEDVPAGELFDAEAALRALANAFFPAEGITDRRRASETERPDIRDMYRILVEQIPAVVFMAYLDRGVGEAYVSPQIEAMLGFTQEEWLKDPERWYQQIHPDDKARWSVDAAQMLLTGDSLRSVYRVMARDGRLIWFQCEAKVVRNAAGQPWFIHGAAFDITELKRTEEALRESEQRLKRHEEELRALTGNLLSAQDEERRRIARELHDSTAQNLAGLAMNLSLLTGAPAASIESNRRILSESLDLADQCSREIRNLSYLLHPPLLEELGLFSVLKSYVAGFSRRTGIPVELELPEVGRLQPEVETTLFRIVQEGLANVHRHSGSPTAAIRIALVGGEVRLVVEDRGAGHKEAAPDPRLAMSGLGVGIPGMGERAQQLGGRMEIQSGSSGTTVIVRLPVKGIT